MKRAKQSSDITKYLCSGRWTEPGNVMTSQSCIVLAAEKCQTMFWHHKAPLFRPMKRAKQCYTITKLHCSDRWKMPSNVLTSQSSIVMADEKSQAMLWHHKAPLFWPMKNAKQCSDITKLHRYGRWKEPSNVMTSQSSIVLTDEKCQAAMFWHHKAPLFWPMKNAKQCNDITKLHRSGRWKEPSKVLTSQSSMSTTWWCQNMVCFFFW